MSTKKAYEAPSIRELGSVHELTQAFNKVGTSPDMYTTISGGAVIGSLVPAPTS